MQILYDFEVTFSNWERTDEVNKLLERLREFIRQRVSVLEERIDKESGAIVINLFDTLKAVLPNLRLGINYNGSSDLEDKILSCFSHQDLNFITSELEKITGLK